MDTKKLTVSERKRIDIINAAKKAFKEFGVKNTTMNQISEIANVSKRTVYKNFENKENLVMVILKDAMDNSSIYEDVDFKNDETLEEQLTILIKNKISVIASKEYIDLFRVALGHFFYNKELLEKEMAKYVDKETAITKWIKKSIKLSLLDVENIQFATEQLNALIKGFCFWPQVMQISEELSEEEISFIVDGHVSLFLAKYKK